MAQQSETQKTGGGAGWFMAAVAAATVGLIYLGATSEHSTVASRVQEVKSSEYDTWMFGSHDTVTIKCDFKEFGGVERPLHLLQVGDTWYGMNGAAMGVGGYRYGRQFMDRDPEYGTYEQNQYEVFSDLQQRVKELCK